MTFVNVDRDKSTVTERTSTLTTEEFRAVIEWKTFDDDIEELEYIIVSKVSDRPKDYTLYCKHPVDIVMLRDLLSAVLVELGEEKAK